MDLGEQVPMGPEEKKAFELFKRDFLKLNQITEGKDPSAQKKKPNGVKPKPKPKPKPGKVPPGNSKGKKAGKEQPSRKDGQSATKEDVIKKLIEDMKANSIIPNFHLNRNTHMDPSCEDFEPASVEAIPQKKVRQVKKKANGPRVPASAANKRKLAVQKRARKTNNKLAADKGKNKKAPKKAIKKKCLKKNQNQPKKEGVKDLKNPEVPEVPETPKLPETPKNPGGFKRFFRLP